MKKMHEVTISLGSNYDKGYTYIQKCMDILSNKFYLKKISKIYKTEPYGFTEQPPFYNAIVIIETNFYPIKMLNYLKSLEKKFNQKKKSNFWGQRIIDLDILYYDDLEIVSNLLIIPHEGIYKREYIKKILYSIQDKKAIEKK